MHEIRIIWKTSSHMIERQNQEIKKVLLEKSKIWYRHRSSAWRFWIEVLVEVLENKQNSPFPNASLPANAPQSAIQTHYNAARRVFCVECAFLHCTLAAKCPRLTQMNMQSTMHCQDTLLSGMLWNALWCSNTEPTRWKQDQNIGFRVQSGVHFIR